MCVTKKNHPPLKPSRFQSGDVLKDTKHAPNLYSKGAARLSYRLIGAHVPDNRKNKTRHPFSQNGRPKGNLGCFSNLISQTPRGFFEISYNSRRDTLMSVESVLSRWLSLLLYRVQCRTNPLKGPLSLKI